MTGPGGVGGPGGFHALRSGQIQGDEARLRTSANLLESEFTATLFRAMRDTVPQESPGADGAQDIFWSMLEREVADQSAMAGGLGLGEALYQAMAGDGGEGQPAPATDAPPALSPLFLGRMNLQSFGQGETP